MYNIFVHHNIVHSEFKITPPPPSGAIPNNVKKIKPSRKFNRYIIFFWKKGKSCFRDF